jgi:large conductance mechanosensitive channel
MKLEIPAAGTLDDPKFSVWSRQAAAPPPLATNKECIYCFSSIPIKATRCPQCTSELKAV